MRVHITTNNKTSLLLLLFIMSFLPLSAVLAEKKTSSNKKKRQHSEVHNGPDLSLDRETYSALFSQWIKDFSDEERAQALADHARLIIKNTKAIKWDKKGYAHFLADELPELWSAVHAEFEAELQSADPNLKKLLKGAFFIHATFYGRPGWTRKLSEAAPYLEMIPMLDKVPLRVRTEALWLLEKTYRGLAWNQYARNGNIADSNYAELAIHFYEMRAELLASVSKQVREIDTWWQLENLEFAGKREEMTNRLEKYAKTFDDFPMWKKQNYLGFKARNHLAKEEFSKSFATLEQALTIMPNRKAFSKERGFDYGVWHTLYKLAKKKDYKPRVLELLAKTAREKPALQPVMTWMSDYIEQGKSRWNTGTTPHRPFMIETIEEPSEYTDNDVKWPVWKALYQKWTQKS